MEQKRNYIQLQYHEIRTIIGFMKEMARDPDGNPHLTDAEMAALKKLQAIQALMESALASKRVAPTRTALARNSSQIRGEEAEKIFESSSDS